VRCLDKAWARSYRTDVPHDCFADEIAIDFPSVGHAVERMRHAFLGETDDVEVVTTELRLSRREAIDGLVVPLAVPIRGTCPSCGGRGESWTESCGDCCGTGETMFRHAVRLSVPRGVAHGATFRFRVSSPHLAPVRVEVRVAVLPSVA
jgi:hypothetical protein